MLVKKFKRTSWQSKWKKHTRSLFFFFKNPSSSFSSFSWLLSLPKLSYSLASPASAFPSSLSTHHSPLKSTLTPTHPHPHPHMHKQFTPHTKRDAKKSFYFQCSLRFTISEFSITFFFPPPTDLHTISLPGNLFTTHPPTTNLPTPWSSLYHQPTQFSSSSS